SPSLRPLGDGAGRGAVGVSDSGTAVLMGTFLRAGGGGAGYLVTAKPPGRGGRAARRRAAWVQPQVMPSPPARVTERRCTAIGAGLAFSAATCCPCSEIMKEA